MTPRTRFPRDPDLLRAWLKARRIDLERLDQQGLSSLELDHFRELEREAHAELQEAKRKWQKAGAPSRGRTARKHDEAYARWEYLLLRTGAEIVAISAVTEFRSALSNLGRERDDAELEPVAPASERSPEDDVLSKLERLVVLRESVH